jgi:hypothetical protein
MLTFAEKSVDGFTALIALTTRVSPEALVIVTCRKPVWKVTLGAPVMVAAALTVPTPDGLLSR